MKGDPELDIFSVNSLFKAGPREITFSIKDDIEVKSLNAGAIIVAEDSQLEYANRIFVEEPFIAFATLLNHFHPHKRYNQGISEHCHLARDVKLGNGVSIGPFTSVRGGSVIGDGTEIHAGVAIYKNVKIGKNCLIYSNVVIREGAEIGNHVILQPGAVIGADGFGFTRLADGTPLKIPQIGKVIIGDHCEIGANTCIDRSTIEETIVNSAVKLDNLVQIGHNVVVGKNSAISAQCGISGSVNIGENVVMGGQVGIADHVKIGDGVMVAAKTGITGNIDEKTVVAGIPHQEIRKWRKSYVLLRNLENYIERIKKLESKIKELEEK